VYCTFISFVTKKFSKQKVILNMLALLKEKVPEKDAQDAIIVS